MASILDSLLPQTRQRILAATLMHPDRWWYVRDLARHLGVAPSHAAKELKSLAEAGILHRRAEGKHVYFQASRSSPVYEELRSMLRKTVGLVSVLESALSPLSKHIKLAFVYGSFARGEETSESDVDLLVVGDLGLAKVSQAVSAAQDELSRAVNPTVYSAQEFAKKLAGSNHFLRSVLADKKLFLVGSEDDLEGVSQ